MGHAQKQTRLAAAIAAAFSFAMPLGAQAQAEPPGETNPVQRVVITGSNIKRIESETSDPVVVLRRVDIERSGVSTLAEMLESLPWTTRSLTDIGEGTNFAPGASSVSMRNMGHEATLVLLNGRRIAPYGLADFQDIFTNIDNLPLDAIERIEILKNGASAVYGSDAVAGVINIITRSDYRGLEMGVDIGATLPGGTFGSQAAHLAAGTGDLKTDGYNVLANFELFHRDNVVWRDVLDRASARSRRYIPAGQDQLSIYSRPGNLYDVGQDTVAPLPGCEAGMLQGGLCLYDRYQRFQAQPAADRASLLVSAKAKLTPEVEGFSDVLWSHTRTTYISANPTYSSSDPATFWGNPKTGETLAFYSPALPASHPLNTTGSPAGLVYRFTDADSKIVGEGDNYRLVAGARGGSGVYEWQSALSLLGSSSSATYSGISFSRSGFSRMIGGRTDMGRPDSEVDPDFFNIPGGYRLNQPNSKEVLSTLFPEYGTNGRFTQVAWDAMLTGELGELDAGAVGFAIGVDLRHERFVMKPTDNVMSGDIVGSGNAQTDGQRQHGAVFAELDLPVSEQFEVQVAGRVDKFPGFEAHLSPKLGLRFQPSRELLLRATAETGFRAPNLTEAASSSRAGFASVSDPRRCAPANAYAADLRAQADALPEDDPRRGALTAQAQQVQENECQAGVLNVVNNNPGLKPEVSRSFTVGMMLEPAADTSVSLDYWNISRKDEIGLRGTDAILDQEAALPPDSRIERSPLRDDRTFTTPELQQRYGVTSGPLSRVMTRFENISRTSTDGVDVAARTRFATPLGGVELGLLGTYLISYRPSYGDGSFSPNLAGYYGNSRWKANLTTSLTSGEVVNGIRLNYRSGTSLQAYPDDTAWNAAGCVANFGLDARDCRVRASVTTDYFVTYSGIRNVTASAYVGNLFNQRPAFDRRAVYDNSDVLPALDDVMGRSLRLALNYKFQ
ncbi:TonB-dependent receptor plug domain-containing protein [Ideonella sp. YS5]|uniref:TonB-dependent receptor plug domain-containing protein n=1 Tax=Ideonella sp. YS5 TaxID=3453714 RepID=UPI003EEA17AC